jgi:hypothetical protein
MTCCTEAKLGHLDFQSVENSWVIVHVAWEVGHGETAARKAHPDSRGKLVWVR